jgi:AraC-like DNA-binding protein
MNILDGVNELISITDEECFLIKHTVSKVFDLPIHYHDGYELNLIIHGEGAERVVGNQVGTVTKTELMLLGPKLPHTWLTSNCKSKMVTEISIQFKKDFFCEGLLRRHQFDKIREMLLQSSNGLLFSTECIKDISQRIKDLSKKTGMDSLLELLSILHDLSVLPDYSILSGTAHQTFTPVLKADKMDRVIDFMHSNYQKQLDLAKLADVVGMSPHEFTRFFKAHSRVSFVEALSDIRIGYASKLLLESSDSIANVAKKCGFINISNFNRVFRKKKNCSPVEFRQSFAERLVYV